MAPQRGHEERVAAVLHALERGVVVVGRGRGGDGSGGVLVVIVIVSIG